MPFVSPPPSKPLDTAWRTYAERVIPMTAPDTQRIECRRAFYAGAQAFLGAMMKHLDPGEDPTDDDLDLMDAMAAELKQFGVDIMAGKA